MKPVRIEVTVKGMHSDIPYRELGRTGERVSAIGIGGWHLALAHVDRPLAIRIVRTALDRGINFLDNCWDYNKGASETRMGSALRNGYRQKAFLMTKIDGRSRKEAARQVDESLRRLQTDCIDLVQHHEILRYEDPDRIFDEQGANRALVDARKAGKLRFIGFTGHKDPHIHLHMLHTAREQGFRFDAVQMPLNVMDAHFRSFEKLVLPVLVRGQIGVLGMKPMANGIILKSKTVVFHIERGDLLDILEHPNPDRYAGQRIFVVQREDYVYLVPFVEDEHMVFLKTIIPSRKATKQYLGEESDDEDGR